MAVHFGEYSTKLNVAVSLQVETLPDIRYSCDPKGLEKARAEQTYGYLHMTGFLY